MTCLATLCRCFHDRWSRRKWSSYYAAVNASEVSVVWGGVVWCGVVWLVVSSRLDGGCGRPAV